MNFSAKQFNQSDLIKQVMQTLHETQLDPGSLGIELTESAAMQEAERTVLVLAELRAVGINTSLDDFGTGYSSLSHLRRLPLNILKLDRCFMSEMLNNNESREIVRTIVDLAHILGLDVIAEGIETVEQANELRSLGCKYAQGYLFSKPLDIIHAEALLKSRGRETNLVTVGNSLPQ